MAKSKIMSHYDVQHFLELIRPLDGSVMRKICESHQELLATRDSLIFALKLCRNHLESIQSGIITAQHLDDVIKSASEAIGDDPRYCNDGYDNKWD